MFHLTTHTIKVSKVVIFLTILLASFVIVDNQQVLALSNLSTDKGTLAGHIPDCGSLGNTECEDVSIFVLTLINISRYLFSIVGALALVFFVYGGLVWITSQGNPEKLKKGLDIFVAAVLGLVIVFSAYMLVSYLATSLGVSSSFKLST